MYKRFNGTKWGGRNNEEKAEFHCTWISNNAHVECIVIEIIFFACIIDWPVTHSVT